ncbi:unnamed protein product, partial [marine sediment metagenome]
LYPLLKETRTQPWVGSYGCARARASTSISSPDTPKRPVGGLPNGSVFPNMPGALKRALIDFWLADRGGLTGVKKGIIFK